MWIVARTEFALWRSCCALLFLGLVTTINVFVLIFFYYSGPRRFLITKVMSNFKFFWNFCETLYFIICDNACNAVSVFRHLLITIFFLILSDARLEVNSQFFWFFLVETNVWFFFISARYFVAFLVESSRSFLCLSFQRKVTWVSPHSFDKSLLLFQQSCLFPAFLIEKKRKSPDKRLEKVSKVLWT